MAPEEYAFLDVETPNKNNDRICSIGIVRTDRRMNIVAEDYLLINPESRFDQVNIDIHGITPDDVALSESFGDAWPRLRGIIDGAAIVAHNASFDLNVLDKTMRAYSIDPMHIEYADTRSLSGTYINSLPEFKLANCKLETVCSACHIPLHHHHNALDDAAACMGIFFTLERYFGIIDKPDTWVEYVPIAERSVCRAYTYNSRRSEESIAFEQLKEISQDIISDGKIDFEEAAFLLRWIDRNYFLSDDIANSITDILSDVLEDGSISAEEENTLLKTLCRIIDPSENVSNSGIDINGHTFVLSGDFDYGKKEDVASILVSHGGISQNDVTMKSDFVIIGAQGSDRYAYGSYGGKVKKAMEYQQRGLPIRIISEHDVDCLS